MKPTPSALGSPYRMNARPPMPRESQLVFRAAMLAGLLLAVIFGALTTGCPEAKTAANDIAIVSAAACEELAQQPNDPAWVALVCQAITDANQIIQAGTSAPTKLVVIPRAQWEAIKAASPASSGPHAAACPFPPSYAKSLAASQ